MLVTHPITSGFATAQTSLTTYMGLAIGLVIGLVLLGAGIRFLAKWVRLALGSASHTEWRD